MFSATRATAAAALTALLANSAPVLQVLRYSPTSDASPAARVTVVFDRPVAGSLDHSVDPASLFTITPTVAGKLEWRDPVTVRFTPAATLQPGSSYTVTISNSFTAMDGSRLKDPFTFTFTVSGPKVLTGLPVGAGNRPKYLKPDQRFTVVFSTPVDLGRVSSLAYLDFNQACRTPGIIRLKAATQRPLGDKEPWQLREAGGYERDREADGLRRLVEFVPERALPLDCGGDLVLPSAVDPEGTSPFLRWGFRTYGPLSLVEARCTGGRFCPSGGIRLTFTAPVRGSEVLRRISVLPTTAFTIADSTNESDNWYLEAQLTPNTGYAVVADTAIRDVFGQRLTGNPAVGFKTTGFAPLVEYPYGRLSVEAAGFRTLMIKHVNVDTLDAVIAPVPAALESRVLQYNRWSNESNDLMDSLLRSPAAERRRIGLTPAKDRVQVYGLKLPERNPAQRGGATLLLVRVRSPGLDTAYNRAEPVSILQVTDLGVHAKVGLREGVVWVTGASDGKARPGARVTLYDTRGRVRASGVTGADGLVRLRGFVPDTVGERGGGFEGYVAAVLGNDRAITVVSQWDPDLSPWQFNVRSAWDVEREAAAGAVFTERGIYRPGETIFAKAIIRDGALGALKAPAAGASLRWTFSDREGGTLRQRSVTLSRFGTASDSLVLGDAVPLGQYSVKVEYKKGANWLQLAEAYYRVAEYRPPEFLVDATTDSAPRFPGDSLVARLQARYLFGAPMGRAAYSWSARLTPMESWALRIPGLDDWFIGENDWSSWDGSNRGPREEQLASGSDTLDPSGVGRVAVALRESAPGVGARATLQATITDVNRQSVSASVSAVVHPSDFYLALKPAGKSYFWTAGTAETIRVAAVRPDGTPVAGVKVEGVLVRKEWHQVHRDRDGYGETVGEWVSDTVNRCSLSTAAEPGSCTFTPSAGGSYVIRFSAVDSKGRPVIASFDRWATGSDWVPWSDESQFKMDVIADKPRYSVGDSATILFASPFTGAEAWITVEREGLIEQRRLRITSGTTTIRLPVTEAYAPNVFVGIVVARGRSAKPGPLDDPGRPTLRVGYAELRVTPEVKRLKVAVEPGKSEYRPGDTAQVAVTVKDVTGKGQRTEVTLWAVDEGVLSLTGYQTPDPLDLLYQPRGLGLRLASNLTTVAPQVPEGEKGGRSPGGGGGQGESDILRSRFKTTAFFLGSVITDSSGRAVARSKLPDNLTTFRVMAVAVTVADRFGSGASPLLVTRPLLARPALPRFVRPGDKFTAGVVVNQRAGGTPTVSLAAEVTGTELTSSSKQQAALEAGRGREMRFDFRQPEGQPGDSSAFRFRVSGAGDADAVEKKIPVQAAIRPLAVTEAGTVTDTATVTFQLPADIDPAASRLVLSLGSSPLSVIRALDWELEVYPYGCSEQVSSAAAPISALLRAQRAAGTVPLLKGNPAAELARAVAILSGRQRADGGIGYWSASDWTTPWLSGYAGTALLDARAAGIAVDDSVLARLGRYLSQSLKREETIRAPVIGWYDALQVHLSDRVAAVDFLSRLGKPDLPAENELLRQAAQLAFEDRLRLAEVLARRGAVKAATGLLQPLWATVRVEGRRAVLPDSLLGREFYFESRVRPVARLLTATLAIDSANALIGPLVETLVQRGRATTGWWWWNTQDYAAAIGGLARFAEFQRNQPPRGVMVGAAGKTLLASDNGSMSRDSTLALTGLIGSEKDGVRPLTLRVSAGAGSAAPIYFYLTVRQVPKERPVKPDDAGIQVERWYERYTDARPVTSITEGELVRVRLRVTVTADRDFVVLDDALPAGLEAIDLSLRTEGSLPGPGAGVQERLRYGNGEDEGDEEYGSYWYYGWWDGGWWSPFDHRELRDDRVVYFATVLWKGTYSVSYVARATTPGVFVRPPAQAEEMYNPAVHGRSDGGLFTVTKK